MKSRPSIVLGMIVKNESLNLSKLFNSISGCFDAVFITDTGSTDDTVKILKSEKLARIADCPIYVSHFKWVNDFSKARNFNLSQIPEDQFDYFMWLDGDDVLDNKEAFLHFRDHTMHVAHIWTANYNYAQNHRGDSVCKFLRERIVKLKMGFKWVDFVHEGLVTDAKLKIDPGKILTWEVKHQRTREDAKADRSRNLKIFEDKKNLNPRMKYYYGKELHDAGDYIKSVKVLQDVVSMENTVNFGIHDRIMALQYLGYSLKECGKYEKAINVGLNALQVEPMRAEYLVNIADCYVRLNRISEAIFYYKAAKRAHKGEVRGGATHTTPNAYNDYPTEQLIQIYFKMGNLQGFKEELRDLEKIGSPHVERFKSLLSGFESDILGPKKEDLTPMDDIVFTTPPGLVVKNWDELSIKVKGVGGSETALIEVARFFKKKTQYNIKVFCPRDEMDLMPSGVEYIPVERAPEYFKKYLPKAHVAWRHNHRLTEAPTYVWQHDLVTPGAHVSNNYEKVICLTEFHKHFCIDVGGLEDKKIEIMPNGLDPELFEIVKSTPKNPNKVVFSSSPDRGWERSIEICLRAREKVPGLELHLFYGTQNMRNMGMGAEADRLDNLIKKYDWIKFHGFVSKLDLMTHMRQASVHLYPADFIETFCITVLEAACSGAWVLTRNVGALKYTLEDVYSRGMCEILDIDPNGSKNFDIWADHLVKALNEEKYKKVDISPYDYSWEKATDRLLEIMGIKALV